MVICDRLKELRESKNLSQGDIEKRTGLQDNSQKGLVHLDHAVVLDEA